MAPDAATPAPTERILGIHDEGVPGPTLVIIGGVHGNEPAGVDALHRVLDWLREAPVRFRGRLVGIVGNLEALAAGERFLDEDLNRIFLPERVAALLEGTALTGTREEHQQRELLSLLHRIFEGADEQVIFLDLHTSSARGEPFVCIGDTLRNRAFAMRYPVPVILGLEEQVDGALLEHVNNLGHVTVGVEAGKHDHPDSVGHHEAFVMLALIAAGCVDEGSVPEAEAYRKRLREAAGVLPRIMEVRYRHPVEPEDGFRMEPGYSNFQQVEAGEVLAHDRSGPIAAPERGRVLLPLYQGLGNDGFFLVRQIRPFWLGVSAWLRRLRFDRIVEWLPGVSRDPDQPRTLRVDPRVARWYTVEIFHLLGYRKERSRDGSLTFARRVE